MLAGLVAACAMSATTAAQWSDYPMKNVPRTKDGKVDLKAPPRRTPDGKIDLSGFWLPTNPVKHLLNLAADWLRRQIYGQPTDADLNPNDPTREDRH